MAHRRYTASDVMTYCRSCHMRVNLDDMRTCVLMIGNCCGLVACVRITRYREREVALEVGIRSRELRQTFSRERADNEDPSLARMSGEKTRDTIAVIRSA